MHWMHPNHHKIQPEGFQLQKTGPCCRRAEIVLARGKSVKNIKSRDTPDQQQLQLTSLVAALSLYSYLPCRCVVAIQEIHEVGAQISTFSVNWWVKMYQRTLEGSIFSESAPNGPKTSPIERASNSTSIWLSKKYFSWKFSIGKYFLKVVKKKYRKIFEKNENFRNFKENINNKKNKIFGNFEKKFFFSSSQLSKIFSGRNFSRKIFFFGSQIDVEFDALSIVGIFGPFGALSEKIEPPQSALVHFYSPIYTKCCLSSGFWTNFVDLLYTI